MTAHSPSAHCAPWPQNHPGRIACTSNARSSPRRRAASSLPLLRISMQAQSSRQCGTLALSREKKSRSTPAAARLSGAAEYGETALQLAPGESSRFSPTASSSHERRSSTLRFDAPAQSAHNPRKQSPPRRPLARMTTSPSSRFKNGARMTALLRLSRPSASPRWLSRRQPATCHVREAHATRFLSQNTIRFAAGSSISLNSELCFSEESSSMNHRRSYLLAACCRHASLQFISAQSIATLDPPSEHASTHRRASLEQTGVPSRRRVVQHGKLA